MHASTTIKTPRYRIEGVKGEYFDVFNQRKNAIRAVIKLAVEFPGTTFLVVKRVNMKDKIVFRFMMEAEFDFADVQDMYHGIIDIFQEKLDRTKYWRK